MPFVPRQIRGPPDSPQSSNANHSRRADFKMRNIGCVFCKKYFTIRDYRHGKSLLPLSRSCGHAICDLCAKNRVNEACPICNDCHSPIAQGSTSSPMLHVYVMGLLHVNKSRSANFDEPNMSFEKSLQAKARKTVVVEPCAECGEPATVKCISCQSHTFCKRCFKNLHQYKTNRDHMMTPLDQDLENAVNLPIFCEMHKDMKLRHWCENCEKPCCQDCALEIHRTHDFEKLRERNIQVFEGFKKAYRSLAGTLFYVQDSRKRLKKTLEPQEVSAKFADIETQINQHFVHLHGVLQNIEGRIIETLRAQSTQREKNLREIDRELEALEKNIGAAVLMGSSSEHHFDSVHLENLIQQLTSLTESPCFYVEETVNDAQNIRFHSDAQAIINYLENHCHLEVVPSLVAAHLMPKQYRPIDNVTDLIEITGIPPLFEIPSALNKIGSQSSSSLSSTASFPSIEADNSRPTQEIPQMEEPSNKSVYSDVHVTHIDSPSNFYIRYATDNAKWMSIQEKLKSYNYSPGVIPSDVQIRQNYAVKSDENDDWQRAAVIGIVPDHERNLKTYDVQYIDIGSQEKGIIKENIRELEGCLKETPPLAENHSLFDLYPKNQKTWDPEACEAMQDVVQNAGSSTLIMRKIDESSHGVDIMASSRKKWMSQSIRDHLVFMELATWTNQERLYKTNPNSVASLHYDTLEIDKHHPVCMMELYDNDATPNEMYIRKANYSEITFKNMMASLQADYDRTKHTRGKIYTPETERICAVRSSTKTWFRGVVVGLPGQQNVQVFYVDYGIKEIVKYSCLRQLDTVYMKAATRAIKISLKDVAPVDKWSTETMIQLREWMRSGVTLVAYEKIDDYYSVSLIDNRTRESLNARLVTQGYAKSTGPASKPSIPRRIPEMIVSPELEAKRKLKRQKTKSKGLKARLHRSSVTTKNTTSSDIKQDDPWKVQVKPVIILSPDEIYVSPFGKEEAYNEMDKKLQKAYRSCHTSKVGPWTVGNVCVIYLKTTMAYRRAEIRAIKSPDDVVVYLLDIGDTLVMSLKDLQPLFPAFNDVPANVFPIKLGGISPPGGSTNWPTASCDKLRTIVEENQLNRFFISKVTDDEGHMIVDFFVEEVKACDAIEPIMREITVINRTMVEAGLALPIRNFNDLKIKILGTDVEKEFDIGDKNPGVAPTSKILEDEWAEGQSQSDTDDSGTVVETDSDSDCPTNDPVEYRCRKQPDWPTWPPPEALPDEHFLAEGTYVDWGGFIFLMTPNNAVKAAEIQHTLQVHCEENKEITEISDWQIGELCLAQTTPKKTWHRAQVVGIKGRHLVICFVDYGNLEWKTTAKLRRTLMFEDVPILTTRCEIKGMKPSYEHGQYTRLDLDKIHYSLVQRKWRVQVVQRLPEHSVVVITHPEYPDDNVLEIMKNQYRIGITTGTSDTDAVSIDDPDVIVDDIIPRQNEILLSEIDLDAQYLSDSPEPEEIKSYDETVYEERERIIMHFVSNTNELYPRISVPDEVLQFHGNIAEVSSEKANILWIHPTESPDSELLTILSRMYRKLMKEMRVEGRDQPPLESFDVGTPCCVIFDDERVCYRGRVIDAMINGGDSFVKVKFVDWENSEWYSSTVLRVPKECWTKLPAMAIKCYLHGLKAVGDNCAVGELLKKFAAAKGEPLTITIHGRVGDALSVEVFTDKNCQSLLYQSLLDNGLFKRDVKKIVEAE